jgi:hypothetical protein
MKRLLEKSCLHLNLPSYEAGRTEKSGATELNSDIAQIHFKTGVEFLGIASYVHQAKGILGRDGSWILI